MKKMKKLIVFLLLTALCAAMVGCVRLPELPVSTPQTETEEAVNPTEPASEEDTDPAAPATETAPRTASGYVFYENDIFSTEIPEGWELQRTKFQYIYDTILEPHEGRSIWDSITVNCGGYKDGDVEALRDDYIQTGLTINYYEITIAGQPAAVIERGGGALGLSMRDIYCEAPNGQRFTLHFNCPDNGEAFSFAAIQEPMDHFLECLRWKTGESQPVSTAPVTEPPAPSTTASTEPLLFFDSVEIEDFAGFEGMTRADLKARYGEPDSDDGSVMTYDSVSWNGWIGNMRFFFDSSAESCKTNCASWTTSGDEGIFNELCDALKSRGWPGESYSPKEGQIEKAYIVNNFELIAGNEDSSSGKWTYLFARLHT